MAGDDLAAGGLAKCVFATDDLACGGFAAGDFTAGALASGGLAADFGGRVGALAGLAVDLARRSEAFATRVDVLPTGVPLRARADAALAVRRRVAEDAFDDVFLTFGL